MESALCNRRISKTGAAGDVRSRFAPAADVAASPAAEHDVRGVGTEARMIDPADPRATLSLSLASFHIKPAIANVERHGYCIGKEIEEQTRGAVELGAATLYRTLKQLITDGWIAEIIRDREVEADDERRRYYR